MSDRLLEQALRSAAAGAPDKPAVVTAERTLTYSELDQAADRVAGGLSEIGVRTGDRVALVLPNGSDMPQAVYGVLRGGAALAPINPTIKQDKLARLLAHVGAAAVICDAEREPVVRAASQQVEDVRVISDLAALGSDAAGPLPRLLGADLAAVLYTSGSTGEPKGVTMTHANMCFVAGSIVEYLEMGPEDRILSVLPLSFGYGLYQLLTCICAHATLVLEPGLGLPGQLVRQLERQRITGLPGVPTVFQMLISLRGLAERKLPCLRFLTNAGAALPEATVQAVRDTFPGARLYSMYGQTECTRVCYLPPDQLAVRPTSVGIAIPGTAAWVQAADGQLAPRGEVGELMVRGAHVMQGYWEDPEGSAERLRPGRWPWDRVLATGDLFRQDSEGYLYFVARRDDIIKSRGEKVAPREVEEILFAVPGVREASVVGVPDRLLGEAVHAHVVLDGSVHLEPRDLRRHCAERLEAHKVPGRVTFHEALPRTPNGKIDRAALIKSPA